METEYEAIIKGLDLLLEIGADSVEIIGDSQLVLKQISGEYDCKDDTLRLYLEECDRLSQGFRLMTLKHVPKGQNMEANDLAQAASGYKPTLDTEIIELDADDWRKEIVDYLENPLSSVPKKLKIKALKFVLIDGDLYYRTLEGVLLKCLNLEEAKVVMCKVHEGICGTHQSAHKMKWLIRRTGYFMPDMLEECFKYYKGCQDCQKFGSIQRAPASAMNPIIKPWPFRGWGIDMIGQIFPVSSKGHKFIIAATDYFTKWVKAVPMKKVMTKDVINFIKEHIINRFGIPQTITTDQGSVFISDEFQIFVDSLGIRLLNSSSYYAQVNGQAESSNKSLIKLIKRKIAEQPKRWHTTLAD